MQIISIVTEYQRKWLKHCQYANTFQNVITNLRCSYNVLCLLSDPDYANGVTGLLCSVRTQSICCCSLAMGSFFLIFCILMHKSQPTSEARCIFSIAHCLFLNCILMHNSQTHKRSKQIRQRARRGTINWSTQHVLLKTIRLRFVVIILHLKLP